MEVFVARQPILDRNEEVFGYELLYRSNAQHNYYTQFDGELATTKVINSVLRIGVEDLSEGKPCFINFTTKWLENTIPSFVHPELLVIEVLETVKPTERILTNIRALKAQGYKIALDDFELHMEDEDYKKLINLADIIKIDVRKTSREQQLKIMNQITNKDIVFLAEKVETREEYKQCFADGFTYFQGYFFSKPTILSMNDIPFQNHSTFILISELSKEEPDIQKLTEVIEGDVSISFKLLRLLNSPAIGLTYKIKSIKQAILLIGLIELRKWAFVLTFRERLEQSNPVTDEIIKLCLSRAKANELISTKIGRSRESASFFLVGLLSLVETIYKQPKEQILVQLPLDDEIKQTILGNDTSFSPALKLIYAMEKGDWKTVDQLTKLLDLEEEVLNQIYSDALTWSINLLDETRVQ